MLHRLPDAEDFSCAPGVAEVEQGLIASEVFRRRWQSEIEKLHSKSIACVCVLASIGYSVRRITHEFES